MAEASQALAPGRRKPPARGRPGPALRCMAQAGPDLPAGSGGKGLRWLASAGPLDDGTMTTRRGRRDVDYGAVKATVTLSPLQALARALTLRAASVPRVQTAVSPASILAQVRCWKRPRCMQTSLSRPSKEMV